MSEIEFLDELPPGARQRNPVIEDRMDVIKADTEKHGRWGHLSTFEGEKAANSASSLTSAMRAKYGPVNANGWEFATRNVDGVHKVFGRFSPHKIEEGVAEKYEADRKAKQREAAAKAKAKAEQKAVEKARAQILAEQAASEPANGSNKVKAGAKG